MRSVLGSAWLYLTRVSVWHNGRALSPKKLEEERAAEQKLAATKGLARLWEMAQNEHKGMYSAYKGLASLPLAQEWNDAIERTRLLFDENVDALGAPGLFSAFQTL